MEAPDPDPLPDICTTVSAEGQLVRELLDRILTVGCRHLNHVLNVCVPHYNRQLLHRALDLPSIVVRPPVSSSSEP